jgi:hypothetical protein
VDDNQRDFSAKLDVMDEHPVGANVAPVLGVDSGRQLGSGVKRSRGESDGKDNGWEYSGEFPRLGECRA